jgi:hypothetical protein
MTIQLESTIRSRKGKTVATVNFEKAFSSTMQAIENRGFRLSATTRTAIAACLAAARDIHLSGELEEFSGHEYRYRLMRALHDKLDYQAAPPRMLNGYKIVERLLSYYCQVQLGDRTQQQRAETVLRELQTQIASKPKIFRDVAALYIGVYRELTPIDLFNTEGRPIGRTATAAKKVAMQFEGQERESVVRTILTELRQLTKEIDQRLSN